MPFKIILLAIVPIMLSSCTVFYAHQSPIQPDSTSIAMEIDTVRFKDLTNTKNYKIKYNNGQYASYTSEILEVGNDSVYVRTYEYLKYKQAIPLENVEGIYYKKLIGVSTALIIGYGIVLAVGTVVAFSYWP